MIHGLVFFKAADQEKDDGRSGFGINNSSCYTIKFWTL